MNNKNSQVFFDCGSSKVRAGLFNKSNQNKNLYYESEFFIDRSNSELQIPKIIISCMSRRCYYYRICF